MVDLVTMIVLIRILRLDSLRVHITHLPCQLRVIHSDISSHSVLVVMLHSLLVVVDSTDHRQEDYIPMTHHIRHLLHGSEFSRFQRIIRSISISIQDSILNSKLSHEEDELVSVQRHLRVDSKYGLVLLLRHFYTSVDHKMLALDSQD